MLGVKKTISFAKHICILFCEVVDTDFDSLVVYKIGETEPPCLIPFSVVSIGRVVCSLY